MKSLSLSVFPLLCPNSDNQYVGNSPLSLRLSVSLSLPLSVPQSLKEGGDR